MRIWTAALAIAALSCLSFAGPAGAQPAATKPAGKPAGGPVAPPVPVKPGTALGADETLLKTAHLGADGDALLSFFKKRVPAADTDTTIADLIKQLADKDEKVIATAEGDLVALGPIAVAALRQAANGVEDKAAAARARQCLQLIEGEPGCRASSAPPPACWPRKSPPPPLRSCSLTCPTPTPRLQRKRSWRCCGVSR